MHYNRNIWPLTSNVFAFLNCICLCVVGLLSTGSQQAVTVKNCGTSILSTHRRGKIVGGDIVPPGKYPWMISMQMNGKHHCGGAILNENWIITAAHCINYNDPSKHEILAGLQNQRVVEASTVQRIKISRIVVHKDFNMIKANNDIALLKTAKPVDIAGSKGYANGICLPETDQDPKGNAKVIGWGRIVEGGNYSNTLREVRVCIVRRDICKKLYYKRHRVLDTMVCTVGKGKGPCNNDSGGPLFQTNSKNVSTLIGIVSYSDGCAKEDSPAVYTKVSAYQSWIENTISKD